MGFAFLAMADMALLLQGPQDGEDGGVGQVDVKVCPNVGHGGRAERQSTFMTSSARSVKCAAIDGANTY
jgi:hypothetical protein